MRGLILALVLALGAPALADDRRQIAVVGTASVSVTPDIATMNVGVTTRRTSAIDALAENSAQVEAVLAALRAGGVADADLQTSGFGIYLRYKDSKLAGPPEVDHYTVGNSVTATMRDLAQVGVILDQVVQVGANEIGGISFGVSEPEPHLNEARRQAVTDARNQAELYAEASGVRLGPILSISEPSADGNPTPGYAVARAAAAVPVAAGQTEISAAVRIVWQIAD
ncbi:MAG: SIMPL domain-containing protein [Pseudomonadota bacterium]